MRHLSLALASVAFLVIGYVIGSFLPLSGFQHSGDSIVGDAELRIHVVTDDGTAVTGLEVDLAETMGPPPEGGYAVSDGNGVATFHVKPGEYLAYFNSNTFPQYLEMIDSYPVSVEDGVANEATIVLETK